MTTPELGWRAWGIEEDQHGPVLTSRGFTRAALPGTVYPTMPAEAMCLRQRCNPDHLPPDPDCTCGLYFTWDRFTVEANVFPNPLNRGAKVLGQVRPIGPVLTVPHDDEGVPDEQRAGAVTLEGEQLITPVCAELAPLLSDRYGIEFRPAEELLTPRPAPAEEAAYDLLDYARDLARQWGLPEPLPWLRRPWDPDWWDPPTKAEQRAQRQSAPDEHSTDPDGGGS